MYADGKGEYPRGKGVSLPKTAKKPTKHCSKHSLKREKKGAFVASAPKIAYHSEMSN